MDPPSPPSPPSLAPPPSRPPSIAGWWLAWRERLTDRRGTIVAVASIVAATALVGVIVLRPPPGPAPRLVLPVAGAEGSGGAAPTAAGAPPAEAVPPGTSPAGTPAGSPAATGTSATVHAAGAVANPGVYAVAAGARVADVLAVAGGPLPEADLDRVNLATRVADGDRVYVARKGEAHGPPAGAAGASAMGPGNVPPAGPVDLNTATLEQLEALPGIGPATAQAIIAYRNRHGRFRSVSQLLDVPGIGPSKLEALRPLVKV